MALPRGLGGRVTAVPSRGPGTQQTLLFPVLVVGVWSRGREGSDLSAGSFQSKFVQDVGWADPLALESLP